MVIKDTICTDLSRFFYLIIHTSNITIAIEIKINKVLVIKGILLLPKRLERIKRLYYSLVHLKGILWAKPSGTCKIKWRKWMDCGWVSTVHLSPFTAARTLFWPLPPNFWFNQSINIKSISCNFKDGETLVQLAA